MTDLARDAMTDRIGTGGTTVAIATPAALWLVSGPDQPANTIQDGSYWLGPNRSLVVAETPGPAPAAGFVSDVTDGYVLLDISGDWPALLAMGCTLAPTALAAGRCAQTMFAGIHVLLAANPIGISPTGIRLFVERPHAAWLLDWFRAAISSLG